MEHYMEVWARLALKLKLAMRTSRQLISNLITDFAAYGDHIGPGPGWPAERLLLHPPQVHGNSHGVLFAHGGPRVADDVDPDEASDAPRKHCSLPEFEFRRQHAAVDAGAAATHRLRRQHAAYLHGGREPTGHASPEKSYSGGKFKPSTTTAAAASPAGVRPIPADSDPHPDGEDHGGRELQQLAEQRVLQRVPAAATEAAATEAAATTTAAATKHGIGRTGI